MLTHTTTPVRSAELENVLTTPGTSRQIAHALLRLSRELPEAAPDAAEPRSLRRRREQETIELLGLYVVLRAFYAGELTG